MKYWLWNFRYYLSWGLRDAFGIASWYSGRKVGKRQENQRIIELLEPLFDKAENAETRRLLTMGIALIKGENK